MLPPRKAIRYGSGEVRICLDWRMRAKICIESLPTRAWLDRLEMLNEQTISGCFGCDGVGFMHCFLETVIGP